MPRESSTLTQLGPDILITPGFVDTHLHAPQLEMIGSYGGDLLEWLNRYTFPTEAQFSDPKHAEMVARIFFEELLRNGTLCALIFSTIHERATDIFFDEAERRGFRAIIGKTMMDRNAPPALLENPKQSYDESRALLQKWRDHAALRADVDAGAARSCGPAQARVSGRVCALAHLGK